MMTREQRIRAMLAHGRRRLRRADLCIEGGQAHAAHLYAAKHWFEAARRLSGLPAHDPDWPPKGIGRPNPRAAKKGQKRNRKA